LGFQDIAELLLKAGASPNPLNDWKYSPLEIGFVKNHFGVIKFLLDYVDVNTKFNLDMCLIHYSFKKITKKVVDEEMKYLIINKECDINAQDFYGESIFHYLAKFTYNKFIIDNNEYFAELFNYDNNISYKEREARKMELYKQLIKKIFSLLVQRKNLDINLVNKKGKTAFQLAIENDNFEFIEEILKLNPQLSFIDESGNSIFHCLVPFIFQNKIPIDKKMYVITEILDRLQDNLSDDELNRISNSYDSNGFTPLLKLMYEYYKNINRIFDQMKDKEAYEYKRSTLALDEINTKSNEDIEYKISTMVLNQKQMNEIRIRALSKLEQFIEFLFKIIKKFVSLRMNPRIKVGKLAAYRKSPTNIDKRKNVNDKDVKQLSKNTRIEMQYYQGQGKNSILLYLMKYPKKMMLEYFINELDIPINIYNLYKRNSLYFLFDNINQIFYIENNNNLVIDTLNYLIEEGINIDQIDYLGNNPFYHLATKNFNEEILHILLNNNCDVNRFNKSDSNTLFYYISQKNLNIVKKLIEDFKVDYTICDSKKRTIMHYLCNDEISSTDMDERLCDYLLTKRIKLNEPDILGRTPLHYLFVKLNDEYNSNDIDPINTLTKLLEYEEVDPEYQDIYGNTPLHYACQRGSIISLITLIERKINYDAKNKENNSPLAYCFLFKKENVAISLIQQNVDIDQYAYPLKDRDEKKIIQDLKMNKSNTLMSVLANEINDQIDKKSDIDLDSSVDFDNEENSVFQFGSKINKTIEFKKNEKKSKKSDIKEEYSIESDENEYEEDLLEQQENNDNNNMNKDEDKEEFDEDEDYNSEDSYQSNNNNNYNYRNNKPVNNIIIKRNLRNNPVIIGKTNNINTFNNLKRLNNNNNSAIPSYIKGFFTKNENKIKLFRLSIKNNFQGLTHLFIARGYGLMKAVEDSFYERKFNLAMKLLIRSPNNQAYQLLNSYGQNLFHILGHVEEKDNLSELPQFLNILYSKHIPLDQKDNFGNTPLHYASKYLFKGFIQFIIKQYGNNSILNIRNNDNYIPLILAMKGKNINLIDKKTFDLLFTNKDINHIYEEDENLLTKLSNPNENNYKCTLLLFIVRMLLLQPAIEKLSTENSNLYYYYTKLIQNGASIMVKDSHGRTSLIYAVLENNFTFLKMLCEKGGNKIDKNAVDTNGKSLVHYCVSLNNFGSYENEQMLNYLLDNGFLSTSKDKLNKTPLDYALEQKTLKNLKILKRKRVPGAEQINIHKNMYKNNQDEIDEQKANLIPKVNFEKDSEEYYNYKLSSAPPELKVKKPNLDDFKSEFFELYKENDEYWDASLTKVNLQNGIYGEYMFYFIQLVHDLGKNMYIVTTQFGRIGEEGANQRSPFNSLEDAKTEFGKIFKSKTGNVWDERNNFQRKKGKYMLLTYNKVKLKPNEILQAFDYEKCPKSKIDNQDIHNLLKAFTDSSIINKAFKASGVDIQFFNYSMLNKETLLKARNYLMELYKKVQELDNLRNMKAINARNDNDPKSKKKKNTKKSKKSKQEEDIEMGEEENENQMDLDNDNNSKDKNGTKKGEKENEEKVLTQKEKIDAIISKTNEIMELSSRYYELMPKEKYRNSCILPLDNLNEVKNEIQIIDNLAYVEKAVNILLGANNKIQVMNPLDYIYYSLQTYFETLNKSSPEYDTLQKYIRNTSDDKIINIFRVTRKGETDRINAFKDLPNHYLLFHGTKIFNLIGIFSNGLKIAPPEAPMTGYLFGKGIYLADMYEKSIGYCDTFQEKNSDPKKRKNYSFILLCEAALGNIYNAKKSDLDVENLPFLKEGYNSLKSVSYSGPDHNKNFVCNSGIIIPLGNIVDYQQGKNDFNSMITSQPEYVVYNTAQVKIRYIVQVERNGYY